MKKLAIITSALLTLSAQASSDYVCQDVYKNKIERMEKHSTLREVGHVTGAVVVGLTSGMLLIAQGPFLPLGVFLMGSLLGTFPGMISYFSLEALDNEDAIKASFEAQELMHVPSADLLKIDERDREEFLQAALLKFSNRITHPSFLNQLVTETDLDRLKNNLPALTTQETIEFYRNKITTEIMSKKLSIVNAISASLDYAKEKGRVPSELTYDGWREILVARQDQFCPNGKAIGLHKVVKNITQ